MGSVTIICMVGGLKVVSLESEEHVLEESAVDLFSQYTN